MDWICLLQFLPRQKQHWPGMYIGQVCTSARIGTNTAAAAAAAGDDDGDDDVCCSHVPRLPLNCCWNSMKTFVETTSTM